MLLLLCYIGLFPVIISSNKNDKNKEKTTESLLSPPHPRDFVFITLEDLTKEFKILTASMNLILALNFISSV